VPGTVEAVRAGRRPQIRGDGTSERDLVFVDDAVNALLVLADLGDAGEAYNVASGASHTVREVVDTVLRVAGSDLEPEVLGGVPPGEGGRRALDAARLRTLGWRPDVPLVEGLRRTIGAD
jgi:nucleoside-diphosphate-sugar epimerase